MPTEMDRRLVGVMLRSIREMAGVTRERLADECGNSVAAIGHWETGRSIPSRANLKVYAELCEVPLADLYRLVGLSDAPISLPSYWRSRGPIPAPQSGDTSMDAGGDTSPRAEDNAPPTPRRGAVPPGYTAPRRPAVAPREHALARTG